MYVCTKWVAPNKGCGKFSVHWFNQVHYSITASKKNVVVFFQFEYAEFSGYVHFFRFRPQIPFLGKFGPKNQNYQFILKFGTWTNSNMQNSMVMFNFSPFYWNYPFWANLVQLIKFVHLSWNLVLRLIRIRSIRMNNSMVHLICFMLEIPFLSKLGPKNENFQFMLKYGT